MAEIVVEAVDVDVHSEEDGSDDHEDVVAHELLGDGVVKSWRSGGGGVELGERMHQQLGRGKKQIYGHKTEQFP